MEEKKHFELNLNKLCRDPKGLGFLLIKIIFAAVLVFFLVSVYSGGDSKDVNLDDIRSQLKSETDITKLMHESSDRDLMQFIGINAADYEQVLYFRNTKALAVDELLLVKAKDESQLAAVEDAVSARIDSQITAYSGYGPEQVKLLENAVVKRVGKYYIYCTAPNADEYREVILNAVQ